MFPVINFTKLSIFAFCFYCLPIIANANMYDQGLVYYSQGKHDSAMKAFYLAAKLGESGAAHMLTRMHSEGLASSANAQESFRWVLVAANEGKPEQQYSAGQMYLDRIGVANRLQSALHWFSLAANQGHIGAHYALAGMYHNGLGTAVDKNKAYNLYQYAASEYSVFAEKGDAKAQNRLAGLYEKGLGVPVNYALAVKWFHRAAVNGLAAAQFNMGRLISADTGDDVKVNPEEALYWLGKASDQGHQQAQSLQAVLQKRWPEFARR